MGYSRRAEVDGPEGVPEERVYFQVKRGPDKFAAELGAVPEPGRINRTSDDRRARHRSGFARSGGVVHN
ncbi:hypothetical protein Aab01nite_05180 [Paractinoplanes abujensis]|nr:hypothetical protein Aab01nite_05180 [Actinoplanes abujensis]